MKTALSYWGNSHLSPQYQTGQAIGGLIGMAIARNAENREQAKINEGLLKFTEGANSNQPSFTATTMDGQPVFNTDYSKAPLNLQNGGQQRGEQAPLLTYDGQPIFYSPNGRQQGGLLSGIADQYKLDPNVFQSSAAPTAEAGSVPGPTPATTPKFETTTRAWNDVRREYWKNQTAQLRELRDKVGNAAFAKLFPQLKQQIVDGETSLKGDYDKQVLDKAYSDFENEQNPRKRILIGMKNGFIGKEGAMMLVQPGTETKVIPTGGGNVVVGYNKLSGRYVNLKDGAEIPAEQLQEMLKQTMTPYQEASIGLQQQANAIRAANAGGGSVSQGRYIDVPGLGKMTPAQVLSVYRQARGGVVEADDGYGNIRKTTKPADPDVLRLLGPVVKQLRGDLGLPQMVDNTGDAAIDQKIANMRAAGADESLIDAMVKEEQNRKNRSNATTQSEIPWEEKVSNVWGI